MPKGPKAQRRPGDVVGNAILVAKIATGEIKDEEFPNKDSQVTAAEIGKKGGMARAAKLTKKRRIAIAQKAAKKRWSSK
ncbi:MAG: RNA-binding protein [Nitrospirales bacterium]|nr:RNA-binding protein [Nitrospirales bacterium]